jgi:hypothetical protein
LSTVYLLFYPLYHIHSSAFYIQSLKYSIFYNKIQDLPYILYNGFLYDVNIWRRGPLKPYRRPSSLKRTEEARRLIRNIFEEAMEEISRDGDEKALP